MHWNSVPGDWLSVELFPPCGYSARYRPHRTILGIALDRQVGVHSFASDQPQRFDAWPNELAITPKGMETYSASETSGEYLRLAIDVRDQFDRSLSRALSVERRVIVRGNRNIAMNSRQLRRVLMSGVADALIVESLCIGLIGSYVSATQKSKGHHRIALRGDRGNCQRVLEYVEANLEAQLSLVSLAEIADLPVYRFLRSFTAIVGVTPHAWIVDQ